MKKKPRHLFAAAALMAASAAASAAPFAIRTVGHITSTDFPNAIAGQSYTVTFIVDNGSTSVQDQSWNGTHLTCLIWRMNDAGDVTFTQDLATTPPTTAQGNVQTNSSGQLEDMFTRVETDSPAVQPGQYSVSNTTFNGAVKWFVDGGATGDLVLFDGVGTATNQGLRSTGGVPLNGWTAPQRVTGPCNDTPYAAPPTPTSVPALGPAGLGLTAALVGLLGWRRRRSA